MVAVNIRLRVCAFETMFNSQRSREIEEFAVSLARDFAARCPLGEGPDAEPARMTLARAIDDASSRAATFQRERQLGMYGKAKLGTAFKIELKNVGYPEEFVASLTRQLLLKMSGK
jgi:hypothetical protein